MRINKFLAETGIVSRRGADAWIDAGRITINGETATLGSKVEDTDVVCVDGTDPSFSQSNRISGGDFAPSSESEENLAVVFHFLAVGKHLLHSGLHIHAVLKRNDLLHVLCCRLHSFTLSYCCFDLTMIIISYCGFDYKGQFTPSQFELASSSPPSFAGDFSE